MFSWLFNIFQFTMAKYYLPINIGNICWNGVDANVSVHFGLCFVSKFFIWKSWCELFRNCPLPTSVFFTFVIFSRENGFEDNLGTHSLIAGLWSSIYSLGEVLGPTLGGTLVEYFDFPTTSTTFAGFNLFLSLSGLAYFFFMRRTKKELSVDVFPKKRELVKKDFSTTEVAEFAVEKFLKAGVRIKNVKTK